MTNAQQQVSNNVKSAPTVQSVETIIEKYHKNLAQVLPHHMNIERVKGIVMNAIRTTPKLALCTPESFLGSVFAAAQLGLEPIGGRCYLIPYQNKRKKPDGSWHTINEVQLLIGYQGYADLFYRHASSLALKWGVVCENDQFDFEYGTNQYLRHKPASMERGQAIGYYVIAELRGSTVFQYASRDECMEHGKKHSKTYVSREWDGKQYVQCEPHFDKNSPWATSPDSMCLKTVLRQLMKVLPLSVELQRAFEADETSRDIKDDVHDVFATPTTTQWELEDEEKKTQENAAPKTDKQA